MNDDSTGTDALGQLLAWSRAMGADAALQDAAVDWLARGPEAPGAGFTLPARTAPLPSDAAAPGARSVSDPVTGAMSPTPQTARPQVSNLAPTVALPTARAPTLAPMIKVAVRPAAPVAATTLVELEAKLRAFDGCGLKATATNLCFYRGAASAKLMVIGEAPGREEDLEGRPFVGRAGQLLDKMLGSIGLGEDQYHITNIVYWRPPGNRTPSPQEVLACRPFLDCQLDLVAPDVVLLLGGTAAKYILETDEAILRLRGKWSEVVFGRRKVAVMATLHPTYLLQTPAAKRQVWRDLLAIKERLRPGAAG